MSSVSKIQLSGQGMSSWCPLEEDRDSEKYIDAQCGHSGGVNVSCALLVLSNPVNQQQSHVSFAIYPLFVSNLSATYNGIGRNADTANKLNSRRLE